MSRKVSALSVRNPDGYWVNTAPFTYEAEQFKKNGYYTAAPHGSKDWMDYWTEQFDRCVNGYTVGGVRITGDHYGYLNFGQIRRIEEKTGRKGPPDFPDFWDGDYNYFHVMDIAQDGCTEQQLRDLRLDVTPRSLTGGKHIIVAKARRKGFSYKLSFKAANKYNTHRSYLVVLGASDAKYLYPRGLMTMAKDYVDFFNQHTAWSKKKLISRQTHIKSGFVEEINGIPVEQGYKSEIMAISFKDNPDAAKGKDATLFIFEEAGVFPNLESAYLMTKPTVEDGIYTTGMIAVFGTGGDMDGGSADFSKMFYSPDDYNLLAFENIWEEEESSTCGFFFPDYMNKAGFMEGANSKKEEAANAELAYRKTLKTPSALNKRLQENPLKPSEAFLQKGGSMFPVAELRVQYERVKTGKVRKGVPCTLTKEEGKVKINYDLTGKLTPIESYPAEQAEGCVVIFEEPEPNAPRGLYKIGYDPVRQDEGTSLASILVFKTLKKFSHTGDTIVAEYTGRPKTSEEAHRIAMLLTELYNGELNFENEVTTIIPFFRMNKKLNLLAAQPDTLISKHIDNSGVNRHYGTHMVEKLKEAGMSYINSWLLTERSIDEHGNSILNLETIKSPALLQELIKYSKGKNADRIMALIMALFSVEEEREATILKTKLNDSVVKDLLNQFNTFRLGAGR